MPGRGEGRGGRGDGGWPADGHVTEMRLQERRSQVAGGCRGHARAPRTRGVGPKEDEASLQTTLASTCHQGGWLGGPEHQGQELWTQLVSSSKQNSGGQ